MERVIGSIRRECLDHVIAFGEASLRRTLFSYFSYYHQTRPHLSLEKDAPEPRPIQPPELGRVVAVPQVGGLHHRYERRCLIGSGPIQLAIGLGESTRAHFFADLRLPLVRQPRIGFLSEGNSAGFACGNNFRSKNMEFAVATGLGS